MRRLNHDGGNVAIVVLTLATVLLGMGALAVDVGLMMVNHAQTQSGADAAALAIARRCAQAAVDPASVAPCTLDNANAIAAQYLDANGDGAAAVDAPSVNLRTYYGGRAGWIRVVGQAVSDPAFAGVLGQDELRVQTAAAARWGPLVADDSAFPLAVCNGPLPGPGSAEVTLVLTPTGDAPQGQEPCTGAPAASPMGWLAPNGPDCTSNISLLEPTWVSVTPSTLGPADAACQQTVDGLFSSLQRWDDDWDGLIYRPRRSARERTRVLAVYDASRGAGPSHPAYSLIAFRFTGVRVGGRELHRQDSWDDEQCGDLAVDVTCIRGYVRPWLPPQDGPIADLDLIGLPGISDTTVLDVRLVE